MSILLLLFVVQERVFLAKLGFSKVTRIHMISFLNAVNSSRQFPVKILIFDELWFILWCLCQSRMEQYRTIIITAIYFSNLSCGTLQERLCQVSGN